MTLLDITTIFSDDDRCRELLERLRWPNGPECPRCKTQEVTRRENNTKLLYCGDCDYQFTVTAGTVFNDSHLPLLKWFIAANLICESRKGMSANQVKRLLGVSYKTAWYLCHRIRAAMKEVDPEMLDGTVEMDETYVGGKPRKGTGYHKRGRGTSKEIVIGIRQRGGSLRFFRADDVKSKTLEKYIKENISEDVDVIMTDDFKSYPAAMGKFSDRHETINHSSRQYVHGDTHTNTVENAFSLLKRGIFGTWHKISAKHLLAYLDEMTFRFNRRNRKDLFIDTLRHMITAPILTFEKLTA